MILDMIIDIKHTKISGILKFQKISDKLRNQTYKDFRRTNISEQHFH